MTSEKLHDALNLLPNDLIAETDALRTRKEKPSLRWQHWAAMAACLAVILLAGSLVPRFLGMDKASEAASKLQMSAAEAPDRQENAAAGFEAAGVNPADGGHVHTPAEASESTDDTSSGYCGNISVTVSLNEKAYAVSGSDAVTLTSILESLDYAPENLCTCPTQFTVTTEVGTVYEVNPSEYFARCDAGQAALTRQQADAIQEVIDRLG